MLLLVCLGFIFCAASRARPQNSRTETVLVFPAGATGPWRAAESGWGEQDAEKKAESVAIAPP